jgi:hypothetical protein
VDGTDGFHQGFFKGTNAKKGLHEPVRQGPGKGIDELTGENKGGIHVVTDCGPRLLVF